MTTTGKIGVSLAVLAASLLPAAAMAQSLPPEVKRMVERAARSGNADRAAAVAATAKDLHPEAAAEIDDVLRIIKTEQEAQRIEDLKTAGVFDNWTGRGQLGGSFATGNSDAVAVAAGLNLVRDGLEFRHAIGLVSDLQRSEGRITQERYAADWQMDWKFSARGWLYARLGWERNTVAGLDARFTEAVGVGYRLVDRPNFRWDVEGGPALSQTRFSDRSESRFAGRGQTSLTWDISPNLQFTEQASVLYQSHNTALQSTSALTAKLFGDFSARASFTIAHETDPPLGRVRTDTISRMSLVYDF